MDADQVPRASNSGNKAGGEWLVAGRSIHMYTECVTVPSTAELLPLAQNA